eukprot:COSAG01_NODE_2830_length_6998_cov_17.705754_2_plen_176_part_00
MRRRRGGTTHGPWSVVSRTRLNSKECWRVFPPPKPSFHKTPALGPLNTCTYSRNTGAGEDNGIDHHQNRLRFPYDSTFLRSRYLHPHPYHTCSCSTVPVRSFLTIVWLMFVSELSAVKTPHPADRTFSHIVYTERSEHATPCLPQMPTSWMKLPTIDVPRGCSPSCPDKNRRRNE